MEFIAGAIIALVGEYAGRKLYESYKRKKIIREAYIPFSRRQ